MSGGVTLSPDSLAFIDAIRIELLKPVGYNGLRHFEIGCGVFATIHSRLIQCLHLARRCAPKSLAYWEIQKFYGAAVLASTALLLNVPDCDHDAFASVMADLVGDAIRPYASSLYAAAILTPNFKDDVRQADLHDALGVGQLDD